jgi:hypothetical protein
MRKKWGGERKFNSGQRGKLLSQQEKNHRGTQVKRYMERGGWYRYRIKREGTEVVDEVSMSFALFIDFELKMTICYCYKSSNLEFPSLD